MTEGPRMLLSLCVGERDRSWEGQAGAVKQQTIVLAKGEHIDLEVSGCR